MGSVPDGRAGMSHASRRKNSRSSIVTDSIKTLKLVHIKKKIIKNTILLKIKHWGLPVQWLGVHLPAQGTRVRSLVREDSTGHRVIEPMHSGARAPQLRPSAA